MTELTRILSAIEGGDPQAAERLLPLVYQELRKLAVRKMAEEKPGQTLQATALVHEAYLRLIGGENPHQWNSRGHFVSAAAEAMRRILVDNVRRKRRPKHGGGYQRLPLELALDAFAGEKVFDDLIDLDDALQKFAREAPIKAEVVKLRYFAGLSIEETAACLGISPMTAKRHWSVARAWLFAALSDQGDRSPEEHSLNGPDPSRS